jgi:predicted ATPase
VGTGARRRRGTRACSGRRCTGNREESRRSVLTGPDTQTHYSISYLLGLLADAHAKAGHHAEAMKVVEEGIAMAEATGERFYIAELYRLRGELCVHHAIHLPERKNIARYEDGLRKAGLPE